MRTNVIVWDIETVPDIRGFASANGHDGKNDHEIRAAMGDKFPKHIYHSIICIGALIAHREPEQWVVDALGAPHVGERSEKALISSFVGRIAELRPQLVTFNGGSFDLPVLRYRAMVHGVAAPGLSMRPYFHRYSDDAIDLCDVLSAFSSQGKVTLHELCRVMGLPGKPDGISGAEVEKYHRDGHIDQIAKYCQSDVVNTYRVWLQRRDPAGPRLRRDAGDPLRVFLEWRRLRVPRPHRGQCPTGSQSCHRRLSVADRPLGTLSRLERPHAGGRGDRASRLLRRRQRQGPALLSGDGNRGQIGQHRRFLGPNSTLLMRALSCALQPQP
jgi:predicted PolB exonuclease-like 3'-5' exonuclease